MKIEPHGDIREGAATIFQFYIAYVQAGFQPDQAMTLVQEILRTQVIASITGNEDD